MATAAAGTLVGDPANITYTFGKQLESRSKSHGSPIASFIGDKASKSLLKKALPMARRSVVRSRDARRRSAAANGDV